MSLRKAYVSKLENVFYLGVQLPVYDTYAKSGREINSGFIGILAYILIKDITVNDDSPKCGITQDVSIQVQVVTLTHAETGEGLHSERIGSEVLKALIPSGTNKVDIREIDGAVSWSGRFVSSRPIDSVTPTQKIFTRNYIFLHKITQ